MECHGRQAYRDWHGCWWPADPLHCVWHSGAARCPTWGEIWCWHEAFLASREIAVVAVGLHKCRPEGPISAPFWWSASGLLPMTTAGQQRVSAARIPYQRLCCVPICRLGGGQVSVFVSRGSCLSLMIGTSRFERRRGVQDTLFCRDAIDPVLLPLLNPAQVQDPFRGQGPAQARRPLGGSSVILKMFSSAPSPLLGSPCT